jgi:hypothetical protein
MFSFLNKENIIVGPKFNRWLVPPAALAIHMCIGMSYGLSVFWLPLSKAFAVSQGLTDAVKCTTGTGFFDQLFVSNCDWSVTTLVTVFQCGIVFLGLSAALWGGW